MVNGKLKGASSVCLVLWKPLDDLIFSTALAGIEHAQRWFSGLELSFEIYAGFFLSKGVTYIDEGLLDLPVMELRQMGHSCCTQPRVVYCRN